MGLFCGQEWIGKEGWDPLTMELLQNKSLCSMPAHARGAPAPDLL